MNCFDKFFVIHRARNCSLISRDLFKGLFLQTEKATIFKNYLKNYLKKTTK